ncbi:MAG: hypothetical protein HRU15_07240 [Planctomycetes bacterium]|nr:hypothetical protein [Planctomycetota bacterium]
MRRIQLLLCVFLCACAGVSNLAAEQLQLEQVILDDGRQLQAVVEVDGDTLTLRSFANNRELGSIRIAASRVTSRNKLVLFDERRQQHVLEEYDYLLIDAKAAEAPKGLALQACIDYLNKRSANDRETARIIFTWICENITYDLSYINIVDPKKVYADKRAVCSGFASLYKHMAQACGLKSEVVVGYAKGRTHKNGTHFDESNHAWNAVKIDGVWSLLDCTWGAGASFDSEFSRKFKPFYFCPKPLELLPTHFPEDENWQLIAEPISQNDFENSLDVRYGYFDYDIHAISHNAADVHSKDALLWMRFRSPKDVRIQAVIKKGEQRLEQNRVMVGYLGSDTIVQSAYPKRGDYTLHILAKKSGEKNYSSVVNYRIHIEESPKVSNEFPQCYEQYYKRRCQLRTPQRRNLLVGGGGENFSIIVPGAKSVQIKNGGKLHKMRASGTRWTKGLDIVPGPVTIYAKFVGGKDGELHGLVQFQAE